MKQPFINICLGFQEAIISGPNKPSLKRTAPPSKKVFIFAFRSQFRPIFRRHWQLLLGGWTNPLWKKTASKWVHASSPNVSGVNIPKNLGKKSSTSTFQFGCRPYTLRDGKLTPCNGTIWHPNWKVQVCWVSRVCDFLPSFFIQALVDSTRPDSLGRTVPGFVFLCFSSMVPGFLVNLGTSPWGRQWFLVRKNGKRGYHT